MKYAGIETFDKVAVHRTLSNICQVQLSLRQRGICMGGVVDAYSPFYRFILNFLHVKIKILSDTNWNL